MMNDKVVSCTTERFRLDVLAGLTMYPKCLDSKYFYDERGDELFQRIMNMPEYYLTDCEMEIFRERTAEMADVLEAGGEPFDLIELGPGDATKSMLLLDHLMERQTAFTYMPVDISDNVLRLLYARLARRWPTLAVEGLQGDYFDMLDLAGDLSPRKKVVLFLGSNIGNMELDEAYDFCRMLRRHLRPEDRMLIGFDLQKDPTVILSAYDDPAGITAAFNLNLLQRINRELDADFDPDQFRHMPIYDPATGDCRSYLVSRSEQQVQIGNGEQMIDFGKDETIHMEISRKYRPEEIRHMAQVCGFAPVLHLTDHRNWFLDAIWQ